MWWLNLLGKRGEIIPARSELIGFLYTFLGKECERILCQMVSSVDDVDYVHTVGVNNLAREAPQIIVVVRVGLDIVPRKFNGSLSVGPHDKKVVSQDNSDIICMCTPCIHLRKNRPAVFVTNKFGLKFNRLSCNVYCTLVTLINSIKHWTYVVADFVHGRSID